MSDSTRANDSVNERDEATTACDPGCGCHSQGLGKKGKVVICLIVGLAAAVVLANNLINKAGAENDGAQQAFVPASITAIDKLAKTTEGDQQQSSLWGKPLVSLASLNEVAAEKNAVFVFLSSEDKKQNQAIIREIEAAAGKIVSSGVVMAAYTLEKGTPDYAQVCSQVPTPCVLAMVKGRGMSVLDRDFTENKLLQTFVAASNPSGCGPSGCGPSGCN